MKTTTQRLFQWLTLFLEKLARRCQGWAGPRYERDPHYKMVGNVISEVASTPVTAEDCSLVEVLPVQQRDTSDYKRKMLMLLAKDALTDSEQQELNEMTAGHEVIILEDT